MQNDQLTDRQKEILNFITESVKKFGFPPTIPEIQKEFNFKSPTGVNDHLNALVKKGSIIRHPNKSRGIKLIGLRKNNQTEENSIQIPIVGQVAAGIPILAEQNIEGYLSIDRTLANSNKVFALRVKGNSMIGAGILDGDYVVVNPQPFLNQGEIGVVMINDEATVKRMFIEKDAIKLISENETVAPKVIKKSEKDITIVGKVKMVIRNL
ncbi:MAG: transcriptional repressor LexA [Elusimicrobiota bacterium]